MLVVVPFLFTSCEKKQVPNKDAVTLAFEYREVDASRCKVEIRSTSTPSYIADDLWYYFRNEYATMIGDGYRYFNLNAETIKVSVWYKPGVAPNYNEIYVSKDFVIDITGVADSIWRSARPIEY